jgi:aspartate/methionine/tyrosine aminotransferase
MVLKLSNRSDIPMFRALDILREVNERSARGEDIIRLEAGQPSQGAPAEALAYAQDMIIKDPKQGYTSAMGMDSLRERIAQYYQNDYGVSVSPERIAVTTGSSCGLILTILAAFDEGDTIVLPAPTYPAYRNMLKAFGIKVIEKETKAEDNYQPTLAWLNSITEPFDGMIVCSPSNPTGTVIDEATLSQICIWCDEKGVRLVSDEAYHGITYGAASETALRFSNSVIATNTFSKYFSMTGWRMGWIVVPEDMAIRVKNLSESLYVSPPTISQHVAYKVFDHTDVLDGYVARYRKNLDILKEELPKAGFGNFVDPQGAFYLYADIREMTNDSIAFCQRMMDEAGVSATPGLDFDVTRGNATLRMCYAGSESDTIEACKRLKNWKR